MMRGQVGYLPRLRLSLLCTVESRRKLWSGSALAMPFPPAPHHGDEHYSSTSIRTDSTFETSLCIHACRITVSSFKENECNGSRFCGTEIDDSSSSLSLAAPGAQKIAYRYNARVEDGDDDQRQRSNCDTYIHRAPSQSHSLGRG